MYKPRRWSILIANIALVVQTIAPVLLSPVHVSAADPVSFSTPSRYIKDTSVGTNRIGIVATNAEHDQVRLTATGPTNFTTTLATYTGTTTRTYYFQANTPGVPAPLTAGAYTLTAEAWNTTSLAWDAASNAAMLYVLDAPTISFNPAAPGTVVSDSANPMTFVADDQYNQASSFYVRLYNQSNVILTTYTPVPRSICDVTNAGTTVSCDVNDIAGWLAIGTNWGSGTYYISVRPTDPSGNTYSFITSPTFTVDTTAPSTTVTGPTNGSITNAPISISGFSLDNVAVQQAVLEYAPTGTGTWTPITTITNPGPTASFSWIRIWTPPADGKYDIRAITTDGVGNQDAGTIITNVEYDTANPTLTQTTPVPSYTNDSTPSVTVNASEAGDIAVSAGSCGLSPSPVAVLNGDTTLTFNSLPDGNYYCALALTDAASNQSAPLNLSSFTVDTISPSTTTSPADNFSTRNNIVISGTATDDTSVGNVRIESSSDNGVTWNPVTPGPLTPASNTATYAWTYTWNPGGSAASGIYDLKITTTDSAGNQAVNFINDILYDRTAPTGNFTAPVNNSSFTSTFNVTGTASDALAGVSSIVITFTDLSSATTTFNLPVGTPWAKTITAADLADGVYGIHLAISDAVGNVRNRDRTNITFDNTAPDTLTISSHTSGGVYRAATWPSAITGTASDATSGIASVALSYSTDSGATWTPLGNAVYAAPNWSLSWTPADGVYDIRAVATDNLGLTSTTQVSSVTLDTVAPALAEVTPVTPSLGNDATPSVTVSSNEPGTLNWVSGACATTGTSSLSSGSTTLTLDALAQGSYPNCSFTITDAAGNVSSPLTLTAFQIDLSKPVMTWTNPTSGSAVRGAFTLTGTATDDFSSVVSISLSLKRGLNPAMVFPLSDLSWIFTASTNSLDANYVPDGTYDVMLAATDAAGNTATDSLSRGTITVDNQAPTLGWTSPINLGLYNGTVSLNGTAVDNGAIDEQSGITQVVVEYRLTSSATWTSLGTLPVTSGSWSTTLTPAVSGSYEFRVNGQDAAGNVASEKTVAITYDRDAPVSTISSPANNVIVNHPITISGQTTDNIGVAKVRLSYRLTGSTGWTPITDLVNSTPGTSYSWSYVWTPGEATYDIMAAGTDTIDNEEHSALASNITYDVTPPTVTSFQILKDGSAVTELTPGDVVTLKVQISDSHGLASFGTVLENTATGKALANINLSLLSGSTYQTSFTVPSAYLDGTTLSASNRWAVGATDSAGNSTSKWSDFSIKLVSATSTTGTTTAVGRTSPNGTSEGSSSTADGQTTELASTPTDDSTTPPPTDNQTLNGNQEVAGASTERPSLWQTWWFWLILIALGGGAYYFIWMRPETE